MRDAISNDIIAIIDSNNEPLETKEIEERVKLKIKKESVTRTKIFYRLNNLRGDRLIEGKFVGPGKGVWIWWRNSAFSKEVKK